MLGTLINAGAVLFGGMIGLLFREHIPHSIVDKIMHVLGLFTLCLGFLMVSEVQNFLLVIISLVFGTVFGELLKIEQGISRVASFLQAKNSSQLSEGLITAFLLFCVGSLTLLAAIEEGTSGSITLFLTKSMLDGITSVFLAASLGVGVLFSVVLMVVFQGSLTLLAKFLQPILSDVILAQLTATGGVLIVALGFVLLKVKEFQIGNMLPSLVIVVVLSLAF